MPRLFTATFLDNPPALESIDSRISGALQSLDPELSSWRASAVPSHSLHVTWHFLGDVSEEKTVQLMQRLDDLYKDHLEQMSCFEIVYDSFEFWPDIKRPRVAVYTIKNPEAIPEAARTLHNLLSDVVAPYLSKESSRHSGFRPHLTLLRLKQRKDSKTRFEPTQIRVKELEKLLPLRMRFDKVDLVESDLKSGKPIYKVIKTLALKETI